MKKLILFICVWGSSMSLLFSNSMISASEIQSETKSGNERSLDLQGTFQTGQMRSFFQPFQVTQTSSFITVYYLTNLSNIQVEIEDDLGQTWYSNTVNPISGGQLSIDISHWDNGNYSIHFTNTAGNSIYGEFEILN